MNAETKKPRLILTGENGNAFNVLGKCCLAARKAGWSKERLDAFKAEAMSGDYDNLLRTCLKHFNVR